MDKHHLAQLCRSFHYQFKDTTLLEQALTHRSASKQNNERLEFLGDAILGLCIAQILYRQFPEQSEGSLTRLRASLVKGDTLAEIAIECALGESLKLGAGERKSGGRRRSSILADAVESILGAIYLEAGLDAVQISIERLFAQRIKQLDPSNLNKDNKTRLQEYLQGRGLPLPVYSVLGISGKDHEQIFNVSCSVTSLSINSEAKGRSRRIAEQDAAKVLLKKLGQI